MGYKHIFILLFLSSLALQVEAGKFNSVLRSGNWYKMGIVGDGVYKVTYEDLSAQGLNPADIDPAKIQVYGNGGEMLPEPNNLPRPTDSTDLVKIPIETQGLGDGSFDAGDYFLFFALGPDTYKYDTAETEFVFKNNIYADTTYYFLTLDEAQPSRMTGQANAGTNFPKVTNYKSYVAYEPDSENILISGREWYGKRIAIGNTRDVTFDTEGLLSNGQLILKTVLVSRSSYKTYFEKRLNGMLIGTDSFATIQEDLYTRRGFEEDKRHLISGMTIPGNKNQLKLSLKYNSTEGSQGSGHVNRTFLIFDRALKLYDGHTIFRSMESLSTNELTYEVSGMGENTRIWDVSNPLKPKRQVFSMNGAKGIFGNISGNALREFVAFNPGNAKAISGMHRVDNQNLRADLSPQMVIITNTELKPSAERLASFRSSDVGGGYKTKVVEVGEIYNEFSSGAQDITAIRDYMKYLYDEGGQKLQHLLLFGRGSYDYKGIINNNIQIVPLYQSRESLHPVYTYSSDDYYAFMKEEEGDWYGDHHMAFGVGRFPVVSLEEANAIVDKIIHYTTNRDNVGNWRNEVVLVADDGDNNLHVRDADELSNIINQQTPFFNVRKLYLDTYEQEPTAFGEVSPQATQALNDVIKRGALVVNFSGHGNERGWMHEEVLTNEVLNGWSNSNKLPLFVTATCEYGRHDNPNERSGAEKMLYKKNGGCIGLVTTSRPVDAGSNLVLNRAFYDAIFDVEDGEYLTMGEVFRRTKNQSQLIGNRNFILLGDPAMRLAYPKEEIVIDDILVERDSTLSTDTIRSLDHVTITGHVGARGNGQLLSGFDGELTALVYDKPAIKRTKGTGKTSVFEFEELENVLFRGKATVTAGEFAFDFVVSKNIAYNFGDGKISLYASKDSSLLDASGAKQDIQIGGSNPGASKDGSKPGIFLYMNDTTFVDGGVTNEDPLFLAKLEDENGISISGYGLNKDLMLTIDDRSPIVVNDFYVSERDTYQQGWVSYPLDSLSEGHHRLSLQAWDNYNNVNKASLEFIVADDAQMALHHVFNYPNPVSGNETTFSFAHNRAGEDLKVTLVIMNNKGERIFMKDYEVLESQARESLNPWKIENSSSIKLESGMYVFRIVVQSQKDGAKNQGFNKMVVIN